MGLLGGVVGVALGWTIGRVINFGTNVYLKRQHFPPEQIWFVPWWLVAGSVAFALIVSLLSGLYPGQPRGEARSGAGPALRIDSHASPSHVSLLLASQRLSSAQSRIDCNQIESHILHEAVHYCVMLPSGLRRGRSNTRCSITCTDWGTTSRLYSNRGDGTCCRICGSSTRSAIS